MPNLKVTSQELESILNELEGELSGYLADTAGRLAKAREEDGSPSPGVGGSPSASSPSASSPSASGSASGSASMGSPSAGSPGEGSPEGAPGEGAPEGEGSPEAEMGGAPEGAEGGEGAVDPAALEAEYAKLPVEELKAHYLAAKAALFSVMGGEGAAAGGAPGAPPAGPDAGAMGAPAGAPPAGPDMGAGAPPAGPDMGGAPPMGAAPAGPGVGAPPPGEEELARSAMPTNPNGGPIAKSEIDELRAQVEAMAKIVNLFVGQPVRKAVTASNYVPAPVPAPAKSLTKSEVTAKLSELTRQGDLKKSDREAINRFYEGSVNIDAIEHLLK